MITGFHTCHLQGSVQQIYDNVPYCSDKHREQWLGQGYYFWTDSCLFAEAWGRNSSKYPNGYVITKFELEIPVDEILDLVGNVADQLNLEQQIREYLARMSQELSNETAKSIPVSKMLDHLRAKAKEKQEQGESFFAYSAIKAADIPNRSISYPFQNGRSEKLFLPTRQQLFCAEGYEDRIKAKDFHKIYRLVKSSYQRQQIPLVRKIK
ncbi:hypothetical protein [Acinetobacter pittii]|uniref:hypothetical protein n=1 Tax=Acinetobacter pittii TaxID=48296 RepID=UPI0032603312